ncbi:PQQ-dependent dehydrogenase, methanol/ethanol family [Nevskia sp.]|uniref:PQQ-dependent dehydrogenase, methanol/ethanol family n=1 Tax=Nevskia sp. TaxID=1929292 RepID=UPI0025E1CC1E|nr:PQQ-dependent dehydrogenase, methanol/ethanol family [Nevskia sp.]
MNNIFLRNLLLKLALPKLALVGLVAFNVGCQRNTSAPAAAPAAEPKLVDTARIAAGDSEPGNWLSTGRTYNEQRYSPLEKVNAGNVAKLGLAWSYKVDIDRGAEATPVVVDGVMYTTGAYSIVYAINAKTGEQLWKYDPEVQRSKSGNACCDVVNRGVAIGQGKVYVAAFDGRVIAINAKDGTKAWEVDAKDGSGRTFALTGAPLLVKNLVLVGSGGAEYNARGYISAFDTATGKLAWRFYTVPGDPAKPDESPALTLARKTWTGKQYWKQGGGGTVWNTIAYDPETDLIYFGTGNGVSWNKLERDEPNGDNLFISSIVAVKAETGEYAWHYQETPNDNWDYDACANIILADITLDGQLRKVLLHAPKNGFFYVLDRKDGKLLSAEKFAPTTWATHVDLKTGRPVVDQKVADWSKEAKVVAPGPFGAHNWQPMSFSPKTGLVYIPAQEVASMMAPHKVVADGAGFDNREGVWNIGGDLPIPADPKVVEQIAASLKGRLIAWDPVAQKQVWSQPYTNIWNGGTLATAGNLVFQGTADGRVVAYSADKGEKLWESPANSGVMAGPMSYEVDGEQYVTVMAGWGGVFPLIGGAISNYAKVRPEARVLTFKIGGTASLPAPKNEAVPLPELQELKADAKTLARGAELFIGNCAQCHGLNAVGGGIIPDLRYLTPEKHAIFAGIVAGAKSDRGMPSFAGRFNPEEVEAIHQYIIERSHDLKQALGSSVEGAASAK